MKNKMSTKPSNIFPPKAKPEILLKQDLKPFGLICSWQIYQYKYYYNTKPAQTCLRILKCKQPCEQETDAWSLLYDIYELNIVQKITDALRPDNTQKQYDNIGQWKKEWSVCNNSLNIFNYFLAMDIYSLFKCIFLLLFQNICMYFLVFFNLNILPDLCSQKAAAKIIFLLCHSAHLPPHTIWNMSVISHYAPSQTHVSYMVSLLHIS